MIPDRLPWRHRARPSATLHEIQVRSTTKLKSELVLMMLQKAGRRRQAETRPVSKLDGWPILNFAFFAKFRVGMLEAGPKAVPVREGDKIEGAGRSFAQPRMWLPHLSWFSKGGHHGRWYQATSLTRRSALGGSFTTARPCRPSRGRKSCSIAPNALQAQLPGRDDRDASTPSTNLFPQPSTIKNPTSCDVQPLLRISKRANWLHA